MPSTITSLQILPANGLQTVDGADAADVNGWVARVTLADDAVATFDPTRIVVTVTDPGFSAAAVPATVTRKVRGKAIVRTQTPNGTTAQTSFAGNTLLTSASGGVRTVYLSLDDLVYAGSTVTAAEAEAGYYGGAEAGSIAGVVNNSTRGYYKPLASWMSLQHERRTGSFSPELVVTHRHGMNGRQAAGVRFSATDEAAGTTGDIDVNAVVLSQEQTQADICEVFRPTVPLTNMTQGHRCILNAKVYPWLGDATAVLDLAVDGIATTGDWSNAQPRTPLRFLCDKTGAYGGAVAVVESGANPANAQVRSSLADARLTPFATPEAAYAALPSWNLANKGHNDAAGADVYLRNVTGVPVSFTIGANITATAGKTWVNVRQDPENTAAAGITFAANRQLPAYTRILAPVTQTTGSIDGNSIWKPLALEAMTLTISGATGPIHFRQPAFIMRNVTVAGLSNLNASPLLGAGSATQKQQLAQAVGVVMEDATVDSVASGMFSLLGCRFKRVRFEDLARATYNLMDAFEGVQFVNTMFRDIRLASAPTIGFNNPITVGFHTLNFIVEPTAATGGGGAWRLGGDTAVQPMDNVVLTYTTIPGSTATHSGPPIERLNLGYTDAAGSVGVIKRIVVRFCIAHQINIKTDTFTNVSGLSGRTKNWETRYGVGHRGNVRVLIDNNGTAYGANGANWSGEAAAPNSAIGTSVAFTDNKAGPSGAGSGTYSLTGTSNGAYDRVPGPATSDTLINGAAVALTPTKFDISGAARRLDGTGAAGAYETTQSAPIAGTGGGTLGDAAVGGAGSVAVAGTGGGTVGDASSTGAGGLAPITGTGGGTVGDVQGSGTGGTSEPGITDTGEIIATAQRTVFFQPIPGGAGAGASLPLNAPNWTAPFDPADRTPFAMDWSQLLDDGETILQIDQITMSAEGALLGVQVDNSAGRSPIISVDHTRTQIWFLCDEAFQANAAFAGAGAQIGLSMLVRTSATPFKLYERTAILTVRQQ
jgi:hypothetical protein